MHLNNIELYSPHCTSTHKEEWWRKRLVSLSIQNSLYSLVLLFVRVLIQPFLTLTPSTLVPTWQACPLLDLFHMMSWNKWPIRFRHLSEARGLACSITLMVSLVSLPCLASFILIFKDLVHCSRDTLEIVPFSHEATPLSSNLIDIKESAKA